MTMAGFPRGFHGYDVLTQRSAASVTSCTAYKAVQLGMLGLTEEAHSILTFLAEQWDKVSNASSGPLSESVSDTIQYMYENTTQAPPKGIEKFNEEQLANLEQYTAQVLPYCPDGVNVATGNEKDFEALKAWRERLESSDTNWAKDASTGYQAMELSSALAGLLNLALRLNKTNETDEIMTRIAGRINANQQSYYLSRIRPAWGKYFVTGFLRSKLGLSERELKKYAQYILKTTKKRFEEGAVDHLQLFKDKSMEEMLAILDSNTLPYKEEFDDDSEFNLPDTILRKPATPEQIAAVEGTIGQPLPDDLKAFYTTTNGTRPVVRRCPGFHYFQNRFPTVQEVFWEDDDYMWDYQFDLLRGDNLPITIDWPGVEGGGIAVYEHDGQGTEYLWHINEPLVAKAKKVLIDAYEAAGEEEKKTVDDLVKDYHGSWERLKEMKTCWYQQGWGDPNGMIVFHDFKEFVSLVVSESMPPL